MTEQDAPIPRSHEARAGHARAKRPRRAGAIATAAALVAVLSATTAARVIKMAQTAEQQRWSD